MRLLTIRNCAERYGAEGHTLRVAVGAARRGWDVHAAFPRTEGTFAMLSECFAGGVRHHDPFVRTRSRLLPVRAAAAAASVLKTMRLIRKTRPDVVQVTGRSPNEAIVYAAACRLMRAPTLVVFQLVHDHLSVRLPLRLVAAWARAKRQRWVAVSEHNRHFLANALRMRREDIGILYNGTETRTADGGMPDQRERIRHDVRREFGFARDARLLLTTGRLVRSKGCFDLLNVVEPVLREFPDVRFVWAGTGTEADALLELARAKGVADVVRFPGYRTDIARLLLAADLFVFPSRREGGCSSSIREAMVHELPIVSSDAGGIPEVVVHETHGLLFPRGDITAMSSSIRWAVSHPCRMREMAQSAKERIQEFSTDRMVDDYARAFESL